MMSCKSKFANVLSDTYSVTSTGFAALTNRFGSIYCPWPRFLRGACGRPLAPLPRLVFRDRLYEKLRLRPRPCDWLFKIIPFLFLYAYWLMARTMYDRGATRVHFKSCSSVILHHMSYNETSRQRTTEPLMPHRHSGLQTEE